ncbi:MAG: hypothetical protein SNJ70_00845 [Armatimonadota bacterium]
MTKKLCDIIGSSHVAGRYNFTEKDYLNEGADKLLEMGSRVIKLWFTNRPKTDYPFNHNWQEIKSLITLAETPYFKEVFSKPFSTYMLEAFNPLKPNLSFEDAFTKEDEDDETECFYEITKYFIEKYKGTAKTFILQNWESDWILTNPEFTKEPSDKVIENMIKWINARQKGVTKARAEVKSDVTVAHAMEVNLIKRAMEGKVTATNNIVPYTNCDLYSYSAYDTSLEDQKLFYDAMDYLSDKSPSSELFGDINIYIGEFGAPENEFDQYKIISETTQTALDWGAHYIVYWEVFCNEKAKEYNGRPTNDDLRGFWLIRPDGTHSPAWEYFNSILK